MATATIYRPDCKDNFTSLSNDIFNFGHHYDLKARDVAVLNHLLSKPEKWNINRKAIANAVNMCERTVSSALKVLQEKGFAGFTRLKNGHTEWFIKLPEAAIQSHIAKSPIETFARCKNYPVLERNNLLEKNEETINPVVVSLPDEMNTPAVKSDLSELTKAQQVLTLNCAIAYIASLKIKGERYDPVAVVRSFAKKSKNGVLTAPVDKTKDDKPIDKKQDDKAGFRAFMLKFREKMKNDFRVTQVIKSNAWGDISYTEFTNFWSEEEKRKSCFAA